MAIRLTALLLVLVLPYLAHAGFSCPACVLPVKMLINYAEVEELPMEKALEKFCHILPSFLEFVCIDIADKYGPALIKVLEKTDSPDIACEMMKLCPTSCKLFDSWDFAGVSEEHIISVGNKLSGLYGEDISHWWDKIVAYIEEEIQSVYKDHMPLFDVDGDNFSSFETFRGAHWRGKDCDDTNDDIYPGRRFSSSQYHALDHDCNGIYGVDSDSGLPWEQILCADTPHYGVAVIGDSAAAHFHIPGEWFNVSKWSKKLFEGAAILAEDELDWPHMSAITGHVASPNGLPRSIYWKMVQRNPCIHRDYQNIAFNGDNARRIQKLAKTLSRDPDKDYPLIAFIFDIGDDVCSESGRMTPVSQFREKYTETLHYLDSTLPKGSHVVVLGLVNSSLEYTTLKDKKHPLGFTYGKMYEFLTCLGCNPCSTVLTNNATMRNIAMQHVKDLNRVFVELQSTLTFSNFTMHYIDDPFYNVVEAYIKDKSHAVENLVEPIDGFHPSQLLLDLTADYVWDKMEEIKIVPPENPNKDKIRQMFGDQGGY